MHVLSVNAGSSSLKVGLYAVAGERAGAAPELVARALVERIGDPGVRATATTADGTTVSVSELLSLSSTGSSARATTGGTITDHGQALDAVLDGFREHGLPEPDAVGHRIVHGGPTLTEHALVDDDVRRALDAAVAFAPLHLPAELALVDATGARFGQVPTVACLDTAFHRDLPAAARRFPLPAWVFDAGVHRYGFHGLSYEYVVGALGADVLGRAVVAHLGSGSSLAAVDHGSPVTTSMGLTPTGGVVMGTRSGDLDPGVLLHLQREHGLDTDALEHLLDHDSGLLGLSGSSNDMRDLLARRDSDAAADLAVAIYCRSVRMAIGAYATLLDGVDTIVFTAGIGEHAPEVRREVCAGLSHLGVALDDDRNAADEPVISPEGAPVTVRVVPTDEDVMIATHTAELAAAAP